MAAGPRTLRCTVLLCALVPVLLAGDELYTGTVQPFLAKNCAGCHNEKNSSGGVSFSSWLKANSQTALADRTRWELVARKIRTGEMPPKELPRPAAEISATVVKWVGDSYARIDRETPPDPGRITAHRLNRYEYKNAVRDLLGLTLNVADDFPVDPYGYGFDNIGDALTLSPVLTEKYLKAAEHIANIAVPPAGPVKPVMSRYVAERMGQARQLHIQTLHEFPVDGEYTLRSAWFQGLRAGMHVEGRLFFDGKEVAKIPLTVFTEMDRGFEKPGVFATAGVHQFEAEITVLDFIKGELPYLEYIQVYGPNQVKAAAESTAFRRLFVCQQHTTACAKQILAPLAQRAYRRPTTPAELNSLLHLTSLARQQGDSFEAGIRLALEAILISPNFLFRIEHDPAGGAPIHPVTDLELATRLSFFLWSSIPDEELLKSAAAGRLRPNLKAEVQRMLQDRRAHSLVENFASQWLQFRNLDVLQPDPAKFPEYTADLREAMRRETELFVNAVIQEDRSILDFLDGRFTFLNERLAKHYGIPNVTGRAFRRVELDGTERSGILTQASVLTVSSYPTRTSPVIRGKWVLENLLGTPPPPPPPDVPPLNEAKVGTTASLREQLEQHRADPTCAGCHARMDPLGFGLENYDAIGRWRKLDGKFPIDPSGTLPNGKSFSGAGELKAILRSDPHAFTQALAEKLLTYALGRGLENYDRAAVDSITAQVEQNGYKFSVLIRAIVESAPFGMRHAAAAQEPVK